MVDKAVRTSVTLNAETRALAVIMTLLTRMWEPSAKRIVRMVAAAFKMTVTEN